MSNASESPVVLTHSWGQLDVEGVGDFGDAKLWPGGGREWDWTETNTHHVPGIQVADMEELLEHGARTIVLTRGMHLVLQTCPETLEHLRTRGILFHVLETKEAARTYNELVTKDERVGGLFHSTC